MINIIIHNNECNKYDIFGCNKGAKLLIQYIQQLNNK